MKVAIVHDWLNQLGGAEGVLEVLAEIFPGAPIYTSIYSPTAMPASYRRWDIRPTWMDRLPAIHRRHQPYLLLYPIAFGNLRLEGYDLVISNKSAFCFGVRLPPETVHLCYCLTPTRFVWDLDSYVERERIGPLARRLIRVFIRRLQRWEQQAANRVHRFIAISREVQMRIRRYYDRDSTIIYPPVDTRRFASISVQEPDHYFLIVSRLVPYKRIDLAIQAFNQLRLPLWIAGDGRDRASLERMAQPNVRFLGRVPDEELGPLLARCRAFILPGKEDFGITPVEAMAAGRPVIAYGGGGALDYVIDGLSGILFHEQTAEALADAVLRFNQAAFDPAVLRAHAGQFDRERFQARMVSCIREQMGEPWSYVSTDRSSSADGG